MLIHSLTQDPTLSVVICNYNHSQFLSDCLQRIVSQSFQPVEVIVIDDGSTDNSCDIVSCFSKQYPIIKLYKNDQNKGIVFSVNKAISLSKGDYIYSASADDRVLPGLFEESINTLKENPQAGLCCSIPVTFDKITNKINENPTKFLQTCYFTPEDLIKIMKRQFFWIAGHTSIIRRTAIIEAGGFIPELKWHCDWFLLHVIAFRYGIAYVPKPLAQLRIIEGSYSSQKKTWRSKNEVYSALLSSIKSSNCKDTIVSFRKSGILSIFAPMIVLVVIKNPKFFTFLDFIFLKRTLFFVLKALLKRAKYWMRGKAADI